MAEAQKMELLSRYVDHEAKAKAFMNDSKILAVKKRIDKINEGLELEVAVAQEKIRADGFNSSSNEAKSGLEFSYVKTLKMALRAKVIADMVSLDRKLFTYDHLDTPPHYDSRNEARLVDHRAKLEVLTTIDRIYKEMLEEMERSHISDSSRMKELSATERYLREKLAFYNHNIKFMGSPWNRAESSARQAAELALEGDGSVADINYENSRSRRARAVGKGLLLVGGAAALAEVTTGIISKTFTGSNDSVHHESDSAVQSAH